MSQKSMAPWPRPAPFGGQAKYGPLNQERFFKKLLRRKEKLCIFK
jgi:hypothetical protein